MVILKEVSMVPESIWRRKSRSFRSFADMGESFISISQMVDCLNFKLGTGIFVVVGL